MRRLTFVGWAAISAALAAGCAAISGLDKLEKVDCTSDCEAGVDASNDVTIDARADMNAGDDAPGDTTIGEAGDGGATDSPADAPADSPNDAPADSPNDAPNDAPADSPADAPPDGGSDCGATNTIQNCGACGNEHDSELRRVRQRVQQHEQHQSRMQRHRVLVHVHRRTLGLQ